MMLEYLLAREVRGIRRVHPEGLGPKEPEKRAAKSFTALPGEGAVGRVEDGLIWLSKGSPMPDDVEVAIVDGKLGSIDLSRGLTFTEEDTLARKGWEISGMPEGGMRTPLAEPFCNSRGVNVCGMREKEERGRGHAYSPKKKAACETLAKPLLLQ